MRRSLLVVVVLQKPPGTSNVRADDHRTSGTKHCAERFHVCLQPYGTGGAYFFISLLPKKKLGLREAHGLAQGHTGKMSQGQDCTPHLLDSPPPP